jgi:drug/metabolite transporter (DMT)-like permease
MPEHHRRSSNGTAYLLAALAALCWSGNHVAGRAAAGHIPPMAISAIRWIVPTLLLWPFVQAQLAKDWPAVRNHWRAMLFLALSGGTVFGALQYIGLQYTTAINVSVLNSLAPVLIAASGAALFRDSLSRLQGFGVAVSLAGVLVIVSKGSPAALRALQFNLGDLIIVLNMALFGIYSACLRLRPAIHWSTFIFLFAAISGVTTLPFWIWEHSRGMTLQPTHLTFATLAYVSVFPSLVAFASWSRGVEIIGSNRAGVFLHLIPGYSAILAGLLLGERIEAFHAVGLGLILAGVWLAARKA